MNAGLFDPWTLLAGLVAYGVAVLLATLLVFGTYRINTLLASRLEQERLLLSGHRSIAISLGSVMLSQAILMRHAVFPAMAVLRDLFLVRLSPGVVLASLAQCALFFVIVSLASIASVVLAVSMFTRLTGKIPEHEEILKDNQAVAIFFACALLSITLILNEGMEDLSRSLIPAGPTGIVRLP
jgi:uncharacterized membrane protein YjfL (UPF0719 family)